MANLIVAESGVEQFSESHWTSLRYFNLYRLALATLFLFSALLNPSIFPAPSAHHLFRQLLGGIYLLATLLAVGLSYRLRRHYSVQLTTSVLVDVIVVALLTHLSDGLGSGLGAILLSTLAAASLVGQGRLVLFYAAAATLAVLFEQSYRAFQQGVDQAGFFQAGVFSTGCFAVAISARLLARRVFANEQLAHQRGIDLRNQTLISQRVIEEMHDGVLVLGRDGMVRQSNPRARRFLALSSGTDDRLVAASPDLARAFNAWQQKTNDENILVRVPLSGMQLRARFVRTQSTQNDVLVFLEDMSRVRDQALQMKLAALGRLTAHIAHEIRNPLSAISHAGELLREERRGEMYERLLRIVLDNSQRLERIVNDILELGRRDRTYPETLDLREALPLFVDEYLVKEELPAETVTLELSGVATLCFDRSHFHRMLWNLLGNALRHSQRSAGSVCLRVCNAKIPEHIELHVIDDGEGVDDVAREHIFEPFFTTHHRGTGLGLYIARELCEANEAQLELLANRPGADFCVLGRASGCR